MAASPVGGSRFLAYAEIPELPCVPQATVYATVAHAVDEGMRTEIQLENYHVRAAARFDLAIHLAADFADIFEVKEGRRQQHGAVETDWDEAAQALTFRYGHPELDQAVVVRVERSPAPMQYQDGALVVALELSPHQPVELHLAVEPIFAGTRRPAPRGVFAAPPTPGTRAAPVADGGAVPVHIERDGGAGVADGDRRPCFTPAWPRARPERPDRRSALYQQFFGRDTLTIGWQALLAMPTMLRDTLRLNAVWQGTVIDDWRDEEPGKMIHQARWGPLALLGIDPFRRYYGDYATPPD